MRHHRGAFDFLRCVGRTSPSFQAVKGQGGHWAMTKARLDDAVRRARVREAATQAHDGVQPYTAIHELALRLVNLNT